MKKQLAFTTARLTRAQEADLGVSNRFIQATGRYDVFLAQSPNAGIDHASRSIEVMDHLKIFQIKTLLCRIPCRTVSLVKPGTWHLSIVLKDT